VRGILAQRLVRMICQACKEPDPSAASREELKALGITGDVPIYRGRGCEQCGGTGYFGRSGIFELLVVDDDIRRLILKNSDPNSIREEARRKGMRTLLEDGALKIKLGVTTPAEVIRVTQEA
ncbi:MAG: type II secretion system protein GspE, partial [Thermodesulfovibrionales bacterium]